MLLAFRPPFLISLILCLILPLYAIILSVVEEKLRSRGAKPEQVLGNFREIDTRRRALTHELETALARRNELSKKIGPLMGAEKKGSITSAQKSELEQLSAEVLKLKEGIPALEEQAKAADKELYDILATIPNLPHDSVPVGKDETANVEVKRWGTQPEFDFTPKPHWELGEQLGDPRPGARHQADRRALCPLLGAGRKAGAGADELHARPAHARARLHRSSAALPGELRVDVRHRPAAKVRSRICSRFRKASATSG